MAHALGVHHEQSRPDRDRYLYLNLHNAWPKMKHNFDKETWISLSRTASASYDMDSIMHYKSNTVPTRSTSVLVGNRSRFS